MFKFPFDLQCHPITHSLIRTLAVFVCVMVTPAAFGAAPQTPQQPKLAKATFAGGCFWCMEAPFDKLPGVKSTISGYIGGKTPNPTYQQVTSGTTGHTEAVEVTYDPAKVSYEKLLEVFWRNIDPTTRNRQFCDSGSQYRSGIFVHDAEQKKLAESSKAELMKNKPFAGDVVTEITLATTFYPAEDYHQDYYLKNAVRYSLYRSGCGRDARLKQLWGSAP